MRKEGAALDAHVLKCDQQRSRIHSIQRRYQSRRLTGSPGACPLIAYAMNFTGTPFPLSNPQPG